MRLFAAISIAAFVFLSGCHKQPTVGVEVDSALTGFIPSSTKALLGVRLDQLKTSEFYKRHAKQMNFQQMATLSDHIGLDPSRDLSVIVVAWDGKQILTLARGTFNSQEVEKKLSLNAPQQKDTVAILPKGIALAGPPEAVKKARDNNGGVPEELQMRLHSVLPGAQLWGASIGVLPLANIPLQSGTQSAISNFSDYVNGTTLGLALDSGVHLKLDISCVSAEGAQRVNDALRGMIGFARLTTKDNELDLLRLWDAIKLDKLERGVQIHADLPADLADKFVDRIPAVLKR